VENVYLQATANLGAPGFRDNSAVGYFSVVGPHIFELINTPAGQKWWSNDTSHQFTQGFVAAVDEYLAELQSDMPGQANATPDEVLENRVLNPTIAAANFVAGQDCLFFRSMRTLSFPPLAAPRRA
jgi:hypothetical protein